MSRETLREDKNVLSKLDIQFITFLFLLVSSNHASPAVHASLKCTWFSGFMKIYENTSFGQVLDRMNLDSMPLRKL